MSNARSACKFNRAILRAPGRSVVNGLRAGDGDAPTHDGVAFEHRAYAKALQSAGVAVTVLEPLEDFPDALFVEDPALVFPEAAIVLRPGAKSRAGEAPILKQALAAQFPAILELPEGCHADGGDVLTTSDLVLIGLSARTDEAGAYALTAALAEIGRKARLVDTPDGVLHFKSDCGLLDDETVLATRRLAENGVFENFKVIETPEGEEAAANCLRVNDLVMLGAHFPRTAEMLDKLGYKVAPLPTTEIGKIDAGLSCMSLRWLMAA